LEWPELVLLFHRLSSGEGELSSRSDGREGSNGKKKKTAKRVGRESSQTKRKKGDHTFTVLLKSV